MPHESVDEKDLELINALQLTPRASWAQLGRALALDPVTVARRWQRLTEAGLAWVTCVIGPSLHSEFCMAYIEIDCVPGRLDDMATALSAEPQVRYVHHLTGLYGLLAVATLRTPAEVSGVPARLGRAAVRCPGVSGRDTDHGLQRAEPMASAQP